MLSRAARRGGGRRCADRVQTGQRKPHPTPALSGTRDRDHKSEAAAAGSWGWGQRPEVWAAGGGERRRNREPPAGGLSEATVPAERAEEMGCSSGRGRAAICHLSSGSSSPSPHPRRLSPRRRLLPSPATCLPSSCRWFLFQHGSGRSGIA